MLDLLTCSDFYVIEPGVVYAQKITAGHRDPVHYRISENL